MRESAGHAPNVDTEAMTAILEEAPLTLAVLYGSVARGEETEGSDVDVAVAFEDDLSSAERTRARLDLIARLSAALDRDAVDVTPLADAPPELRRAIRADGIVLLGSASDLDASLADLPDARSHDERLAAFDELLSDIERVV
jgi:predicted nucleotidyltransferase